MNWLQVKQHFRIIQSAPRCHHTITPIATVDDAASIFEDFVTFCFIPKDYYDEEESFCFKMLFADQCDEYGDELVVNGSFVDGITGWQYFSNFGLAFRQAFINIQGVGTLRNVFDGSGVLDFNPNVYLPGITNFAFSFNMLAPLMDPTARLSFYVGGRTLIDVNADGSYSGVVNTLPPEVNFSQVFFQGAGVIDGLAFVKDFSIIPVTLVDTSYLSQCIYVRPDHSCTRVIKAYCRNNSFGFNYTGTGFKPQMRLPIIKFAASYPGKESSYENSRGRKDLITSSLEKYWTLSTNMLPESAHDFLALARRCTYFLIDDVEYRPVDASHEPTWVTDPAYPLAAVEFDVRKTEIGLFNNACE